MQNAELGSQNPVAENQQVGSGQPAVGGKCRMLNEEGGRLAASPHSAFCIQHSAFTTRAYCAMATERTGVVETGLTGLLGCSSRLLGMISSGLGSPAGIVAAGAVAGRLAAPLRTWRISMPGAMSPACGQPCAGTTQTREPLAGMPSG